MANRFLTALMLAVVLFMTPVAARAQNLSDLLVDLIQTDIFLAPPPAGINHSAHFVPGDNQQIAPFFFNQELVSQLATSPLGSSSGGFSYSFDPALGTFQRSTDSFGPAFAERALTNGRRKVTVGANFQYSKYNSFEGRSLDNGEVKFYLRHEDTGGAFFEGDLIEAALKLTLTSNTTTFFVNYGVTDTFDVAMTLPLVHVSMDATVDATVLRLATGDSSTIHTFVGGGTTGTYTDSGSATGIGDIILRGKYRLRSTPGGGIALGLDLRLPTGDAENLLGTGATQANFVLIASTRRGRLAPHVNVGYSAASSGDVVNIPNEIGYKVGTEFALRPTATLSVDLLGRTLLDAGRLKFGDTTFNYTDVLGTPKSTTLQEFTAGNGSLNLASLAVGGKFNVKGNLLLSGQVLIALTSSGVTSRFTPVVGFDYSF